jgi:hypothetical protein
MNRKNSKKDGKVEKTLRLKAITATISGQDDAAHHPETPEKQNCPNQVSTKFWTTSNLVKEYGSLTESVG